MSAISSSDFVFTPKVWKDHIRAYFNQKLVYGALATMDDTLTAQPGDTINFPYFKAIGAVEEPLEDASLTVDKLSDDSFQSTVKEVGKAVGIKKKAFKRSATTADKIITEIQQQMARVHAEKIDLDLVNEINAAGNSTTGFQASVATDKMTIRTLLTAKVKAFGDKHDQAVAVQMHSLQWLDLMTDNVTGFLNANAVSPFQAIDGYQGTLLGMAIFVTDQSPKQSAQVAGKDVYNAFIHKVNPYGIIMKQDMEVDNDYDTLAREWVFTSNEWYAVKSFHAKVSPLDRKTALCATVVG
jgi:N4-gp56 family major capsid protein